MLCCIVVPKKPFGKSVCNHCSASRWKTDVPLLFRFCKGFVVSGGVKASESAQVIQSMAEVEEAGQGARGCQMCDLFHHCMHKSVTADSQLETYGNPNGCLQSAEDGKQKWGRIQGNGNGERYKILEMHVKQIKKNLLFICSSHLQSCFTAHTSTVLPQGMQEFHPSFHH